MNKFLNPIFSLVSLFGQVIGGLICGIALIPSIWLVTWVWKNIHASISNFWDLLFLSLSLGMAYFLFGVNLLITIAIIRNLFQIKNHEGRNQIISFRTIKFATYSYLLALARHFILPLVRSTPIINLFYQAMGAKIGKNVLIGTFSIWDCDLVEIGDNCVIGGAVSINAHIGQGKKGRMRRVRIGNQVTIGANTYVMPGVVIEDNVLIGPNSVIPMGKRLKANSVYWGIPVKLVSEKADIP
jgi:acetyltransferase-like isoleucine patch superfamily enzyme